MLRDSLTTASMASVVAALGLACGSVRSDPAEPPGTVPNDEWDVRPLAPVSFAPDAFAFNSGQGIFGGGGSARRFQFTGEWLELPRVEYPAGSLAGLDQYGLQGSAGAVITDQTTLYLYQVDSSDWQLTDSLPASADGFWSRICISEERMLVGGGAPGVLATVFGRTGGAWSTEQDLPEPAGGAHYRLVALEGNVALVGLAGDGTGGGSIGIYSFVHDGTRWNQTSWLPLGDLVSLGTLTLRDGVIAAAGAVPNGTLAPNSEDPDGFCRVLLFREPSAPVLERVFDLPGTLGGTQGCTAAADASMAVMGDPFDPIIKAPVHRPTGDAYVSVQSDAGWTEPVPLVPEGLEDWDLYGSNVAVSEGTVVVGAVDGRKVFAFWRKAASP